MACEWWFYHLERPPLSAALAPLFEKCLERGWRVIVSSQNASQLSELDAELWKWRDDSFLPHGMAGEHGSRQPVLLTGGMNNENKSDILVLLSGQDCETADQPYQRVMVVFEDADMSARNTARLQYKRARDDGMTVRYFQQTPAGGWSEKSG
ncbi:MAG: DNA polymerase III subunit chi [Ponticaulis sp.]|nr:DNA polymerase III subunit chi [Ponticaulis sp.]